MVQSPLFGQHFLSTQISQKRTAVQLEKYSLFTPTTVRTTADSSFIGKAIIAKMSVNEAELKRLETQQKSFLQISVPIAGNKMMELELVPYTVFAPSFKIRNAAGQPLPWDADGRFFHGIIKGDEHSVASVSIINGEISGVISSRKGNFNLVKEATSSNYLFFHEQDLKKQPTLNCFTQEVPLSAMERELLKSSDVITNIACGSVEIYIEADHQLYLDQGSSMTNTINYVTALFSKVATLYTNENLSIVISEIKIWNTVDPYAGGTSSLQVLNEFQAQLGSAFNGRVALLLSGRGIGGGIAFQNVLCSKEFAFAVAGNLESVVPDLPIYSWSVMVVAHELGHSFGSPHTHNCSWPGGAIDNCVTPEGNCAPGPVPENGGTIMSYCNYTSYGINLANGFGLLPGNLMRSRAQHCLGSTLSPSQLATQEIYDTQALVTWLHANGNYTVQYRALPSGSWVTAAVTKTKHAYITSLTPNTAYEWRVNADCSEFTGSTFTTNSIPAPPPYCSTHHVNGCENRLSIANIRVDTTIINHTLDCTAGGYELFPSPALKVMKGQTYSFSVNLESYLNRAKISIYIDLNNDHVFQSNENVYTSSSPVTQAITDSIRIPAGPLTVTGRTRMRFVLNFDELSTAACGEIGAGETEDYYITISTPCEEPLVLVSPTNDYVGGSIVKQSNTTITAFNKVGAAAEVTYRAGASVMLGNGFQTSAGAVFKAEISGCN